MNRSVRFVLLLVAIAAVAAACAGGGAAPSGVATLGSPSPGPDGQPTPEASVDPEEALLAYAECMRENGIDMPDPQVGPNGQISVTIGDGGGAPVDREEMQAAQEACQDLMEGVMGEPQELTPEQKDSMLAFAQCMRDHGIDMPDPQFESGGAIMIGPGPDGGQGPAFDPRSSEFKEAEEACREATGDFGRGPAAAPGGGTEGGPGGSETKP